MDVLFPNKNDDWSHVLRKPTFYIGENKGADQLRSICEADQRLCFRYMDNTIPHDAAHLSLLLETTCYWSTDPARIREKRDQYPTHKGGGPIEGTASGRFTFRKIGHCA